ncbi:hypothetical protein PRZ48_012389 [Zasmidium cellare]|uniref:Zn(2)-C6 fungal-type domain-containing protein n=1 Tax=Zasmidium cellare TaxID=395010 RepID=A0ABR0E503_ZASCE|nr:hypothetical protein PRZ48_012389 [Zasmidium cellare]
MIDEGTMNDSPRATEAPSYLARKTHRKSRLGCLECKRRRVKCDETHPACNNCTRRSTPCNYPAGNVTSPRERPRSRPENDHHRASLLAAADSRAPSSISVTPPLSLDNASLTLPPILSPTRPAVPPSSAAPFFDGFDLELWHHWLSVVCSLNTSPEEVPMWRDHISKLAFKYGYVAQLILAFSALHLAREDRSREAMCLARSNTLESAAISGMMDTLSKDASSNAGALWVASMMLCFCSFGKGPQPGQYLIYSETREPEWLGLLQGVKTIMETSPDAISSVVPKTDKPAADPTEPMSPEQVVPGLGKALDDLRTSVDAFRAEDPSFEKYLHPLDELRKCFGTAFERRIESNTIKICSQMVFAWLYRLEEHYLATLQAKRPMALVILAHYLVLLSQLEGYWYIHGWVPHIMEAIKRHLHPAYQQWLQWPQRYIKT